jgi:dienelactone hydrolase
MGQAPTGDLTGWTRSAFSAAGVTHDVYEKGSGPGVVLLPELPGATPEVLGLAEFLVKHGFTVAVASLYGTPGQPLGMGALVRTLPRVCISREFQAFARGAHRPVADFTRALARDLNARTPGVGVGVIGMCFSGGFALAAAADEMVLAAVGSQPSIPFPISASRRRDPGMSDGELAAITQRAKEEDVCLLGLRFSQDGASPAARFETLRDHLGGAFQVIELDSGPANPDHYPRNAHMVITGEVRLNPPNSAATARDRVAAFLRERLT